MRLIKQFDQRVWLIGLTLVLLTVGSGFAYIQAHKNKNSNRQQPKEISEILKTNDIHVQEKLYVALMKRVGAPQAQEDLFHSGLPFSGTTHLLNHKAGDYLYETYGLKGLVQCKEYFLASCYHGFLLNVIGAGEVKDAQQLSVVMKYCQSKGNQVIVQCSHAIGHGFLAAYGYKELPLALTKCDAAAKAIPSLIAFNCYDGVFMENVWGVHDGGVPSPDRWVDTKDIMYPCDSPAIGTKYLPACWSNQPSLIFQYTQGNTKATAQICQELTDTTLQNKCFDALARQLQAVSYGNVEKEFTNCQQFPDDKIHDCILTMQGANFALGERQDVFKLCGYAGTDAAYCFEGLSANIHTYATSRKEIVELCGKIEATEWKQYCLAAK